MKKNLLLAVSMVFGLSLHSLMAATNLVPNSGFESGTANWLVEFGDFSIFAANGPSASGTASALLGGASTSDQGQIYQSIATVPGTSYVVQFDYETLDTGTPNPNFAEVLVSDSNGNTLFNADPVGTTTFQTAIGTFIATTGSSTVYARGRDKVVVDNVIISSGSFSAPGKYTGSVKRSSTIPSQSIGSLHTESVVARITPTGGFYLIKQPSGEIENGGFVNEHTLAISESGTTAAVTVKDNKDIKFTTIYNTTTNVPGGLDVPVTDTETFSLKKK
jgi:hypothetical protein